MSEDPVKQALLADIAQTHARFCELMNERLTEVDVEMLELYFTSLDKLADRLDDRDRSLVQTAQETFTEVAAVVMSKL